MTVAELIQRVRNLADEYGAEQLQDDDAGDTSAPLGVSQLLQDAYVEFARRTRCCVETLRLATIAERAVYGFGAFGQEAADTDSVSALELANNTDPFTLVADEPSGTSVDGHYISVSFKNTDGAAKTLTAVTCSVVGTDWLGAALTEAIVFTAVSVAGGATLTMTGTRRFATLTSITPSAAQVLATWQHSAGVGAQSAGTRIWQPRDLYYNNDPLAFALRGQLGEINRQWPSESAGTPLWWAREGGRALRVYPGTATADQDLMLMAYVSPDLAAWADDYEPDLDEHHAALLPVKAVVDFVLRSPSDANKDRAQPLATLWEAGIGAARVEFNSTAKADIELGRHGGLSGPRYRYPITIEGI